LRASRKENVFRRIERFFREVWSELSKVLWPSKQEIVNNTIVVIGVLVTFGGCVWVLDLVFRYLVRALGLYST
jgi:preprotein translocase subunit SecE